MHSTRLRQHVAGSSILIAASFILIVMFFTDRSWSDVVVLKNGRTIEGVVVQKKDSIEVSTSYGITLTFDKKEVSRIKHGSSADPVGQSTWHSNMFKPLPYGNEPCYGREDEQTITIGNGKIELVFSKDAKGGIISFVDKLTDTQFISSPDTPILYMVNAQGLLGGSWGMLNYGAIEHKTTLHVSDQRVRLIIENKRQDIDFRKESIAINVICEFILQQGQDSFTAKIEAMNLEKIYITDVTFPLFYSLGQIGANGADDRVLLPFWEGMLIRDPNANIAHGSILSYRYPGDCSMQLWAYFDSRAGFYFYPKDSKGNPKEIFCDRHLYNQEVLVGGVKNMLSRNLGYSFKPDYEFEIGVFHGGWELAAEAYRNWAIEQEWCSSSIRERADIPDWVKNGEPFLAGQNYSQDGALFMELGMIPEIAQRYNDKLNTNFTYMLDGWEKEGAFIGPNYLPPRAGKEKFMAATAAMKQENNRVGASISATQWRLRRVDMNYNGVDLFNRSGYEYAARNIDGSVYMNPFDAAKGWDSVYMNPASREWRQIVAVNAGKLAQNGVSWINLLDFPAGTPYPSYDQRQKHIIGWSNSITQGFQELLSYTRDTIKAVDKEGVLTISAPCEFYLPYIDAYLTSSSAAETSDEYQTLYQDAHYRDIAELIPLFPYVYSDYAVGFSTRPDLVYGQTEHLRLILARSLTRGQIPCVQINNHLPFEIIQSEFNYLKKILQLYRVAGREFFIEGRMLPADPIPVPLKMIRVNMKDGTGFEFRVPSVMHAAWESPDGDIAMVMCNLTKEVQTVQAIMRDWTGKRRNFDLFGYKQGGFFRLQENVDMPRKINFEIPPDDVAMIIAVESLSPDGRERVKKWRELLKSNPPAPEPVKKLPRVLFDEYHDSANTLSFVRARKLNPRDPMKAFAGDLVDPDLYNISRHANAPFTWELLEEYDLIIVSAPHKAFSNDEIIAIDNYLSGGGKMIVIGDAEIPYDINNMLSRFGLYFNPDVLKTTGANIGGQPDSFWLNDVDNNHPITRFTLWEKVDRSGSLEIKKAQTPRVLIRTGADVWRDSVENGKFDSIEKRGPFPYLVSCMHGSGMIIAFADNEYYDRATLVKRAMYWLLYGDF